MTAEQLLEWALKNIHTSNWRFLLIMKTYEDEIKKLTQEQVDGIELFINLLEKNQFYMGFPDGVVNVKDLKETLSTIRKIRTGEEK